MKEKEKILSSLTVEEKASLLSQFVLERTVVTKYGLTGFLLADGPSGIRKMKEEESDDIYDTLPLTCYPSASTYACSWNRELLYELGHHLGIEAQAQNVDVLLGPGCNIKRSPLGGRNFEYYSEDPVLTGELATEYIKGLQEEGVGACVKHFVANNQETRRMTINEKIDARTLHEIYLKAFEKPVQEAKPYMVMSAYNRVNGEYGAESDVTLRDTLRKEWGYEGNVITDCFGAHDLAKAIKNGLNLQMSGESAGRLAEEVKMLIQAGKLTEKELDKAVIRTIELSLKCRDRSRKEQYDKETHHEFARKMAAQSMVLLKNENHFLPFTGKESIAVIGGMAGNLRFQGGGSSHVTPYRLEQVYDAVKDICPQTIFAPGYDGDTSTEEMMEAAVKAASISEKVIMCMGLPEIYESEGYDRVHMKLPTCQEELLGRILEVNENVVVVLFHGAPVEMQWTETTKAVLDAYLPGEAGGGAAANLIFGVENPCGKLAESVPLRLADTPCYLNFPGGWDTVTYAEGIYVGYRYYDKKEMQVAFPFGYGLSYTQFAYHNLRTKKEGNTIHVYLQVENTGDMAGREIVQLYVKKPGIWYDCPVRELADFQNVLLDPGETKNVTLCLTEKNCSVYDEEQEKWLLEGGCYGIEAGASSRDIRLSCEVKIESGRKLPRITENTCLDDMIQLFGKQELLRSLLAKHPESMRYLEMCMDENPMIRSMGALMSFATLRRIDNLLKEEDIAFFLEKLNA